LQYYRRLEIVRRISYIISRYLCSELPCRALISVYGIGVEVDIKIDMLSRYVEVGTHSGVGIDIVAVLGRNGHSAYAEVYEADRMIACGARAG